MARRTPGDAASSSCLLEETRKLDGHPNKLLEGLNRLRLDKLFCDVVLCCDGQEFPCHRVVLASISSYFEAALEGGVMARRTPGDAASSSCLLEETRKLDGHPNKLLEGLNRLRLDKLFCDVVLCCDGQEFPCHRVVLASISSYFEAMFTTGMVESTQERVKVDGVEPEVVNMLVSFAYTSEVSISPENVQALLAGADLMDVTDVREACCDYMQRHMTINNCVEVHLVADKYSCEELQKSSMDYILENFSVVYKQEEFLSVSVDKLTEILSSDRLNVPEEDMVFDAAILWLNTCPERRQSFDKVLEHIRLPLISPSHLPTVMEALDVVKEHQACQRFISDAETYQRLISEAEEQRLQSYRNTARPRRTTVIVMMGYHDGTLHSFDPKTQQSKRLTRVPPDVDKPCTVVSGSFLYVAGSDGRVSKKLWCYDLHRDTWLERASMNEERLCFNLVMLDGRLFVLGQTLEDAVGSVECYDPNSNTWELKCVNMPDSYEGSFISSVVALDGLIYLFGTHGVSTYNPTSGEWTEVDPMWNDRYNVSACTLNGKIYAMGGQIIDEELEEVDMAMVECFNPQTDRWTMCAPMQNTCCFPDVAVVDGMIYVLGTGGGRRDIERYCAETDTWETVGRKPADINTQVCGTARLP